MHSYTLRGSREEGADVGEPSWTFWTRRRGDGWRCHGGSHCTEKEKSSGSFRWGNGSQSKACNYRHTERECGRRAGVTNTPGTTGRLRFSVSLQDSAQSPPSLPSNTRIKRSLLHSPSIYFLFLILRLYSFCQRTLVPPEDVDSIFLGHFAATWGLNLLVMFSFSFFFFEKATNWFVSRKKKKKKRKSGNHVKNVERRG